MANEFESKEEEAAWERSGVPPVRDVLKREHDEAQKRPRNIAVEKWGPMIEEKIERDLERERKKGPKLPDKLPTPGKPPKKDGPDVGMKGCIETDKEACIAEAKERYVVIPLRDLPKGGHEETKGRLTNEMLVGIHRLSQHEYQKLGPKRHEPDLDKG